MRSRLARPARAVRTPHSMCLARITVPLPFSVRHRPLIPTPSAGEITAPWTPVVSLPALNHALIVMGRHIEMHEVYSSVCSIRGEGEDQGRVRITVVKFGLAPG